LERDKHLKNNDGGIHLVIEHTTYFLCLSLTKL